MFRTRKQTAELRLLGTESHTDLREELIHEGGVVHGDLHLVVILIACLRGIRGAAASEEQHQRLQRAGRGARDGLTFVFCFRCQQRQQSLRIIVLSPQLENHRLAQGWANFWTLWWSTMDCQI